MEGAPLVATPGTKQFSRINLSCQSEYYRLQVASEFSEPSAGPGSGVSPSRS